MCIRDRAAEDGEDSERSEDLLLCLHVRLPSDDGLVAARLAQAPAHDAEAVSYTHLDVYKRQIGHRSASSITTSTADSTDRLGSTRLGRALGTEKGRP